MNEALYKSLKEEAKKEYDSAVNAANFARKQEEQDAKEFEQRITNEEKARVKDAQNLVAKASDNVEKRFRLADLNKVQQEADAHLKDVRFATQRRIQYAKDIETNQIAQAKELYEAALVSAQSKAEEPTDQDDFFTSVLDDLEIAETDSSSDVSEEASNIDNPIEAAIDDLLGEVPTVNPIIPEHKIVEDIPSQMPMEKATIVSASNESNIRIEIYDYERINAKTAETMIKSFDKLKVVMSMHNNQIKTLLCTTTNNVAVLEMLKTLPNLADISVNGNVYKLRLRY